jgi:hypothetical protein
MSAAIAWPKPMSRRRDVIEAVAGAVVECVLPDQVATAKLDIAAEREEHES